jgi:hypothetical protein
VTYQAYHDFLMWGFYVLGCMFVAFLVVALVATVAAWCCERRYTTTAAEDDQPEKFPPTHVYFTRHRLHF